MDFIRKDFDMIYMRYLCVALAATLLAVYASLWVMSPAPLERHAVTLPPLRVSQQGNDLLLWGGWKALKGYDHAIEIRCDRELSRCDEAYASILQHDAGEDLEA